MQFENVKCFLITPNGKAIRALRRYATAPEESPCPGQYKVFHNASVFLDFVAYDEKLSGADSTTLKSMFTGWPTKCEYCAYVFTDTDCFQLNTNALYTGINEKGEEITTSLRDAPPGAMYDAEWYHDYAGWCGADGKALYVVCPDGHPWHIDGRCSNCTMKNDNVHKCWVREGIPPDITVGKNGFTCAAGSGSIQTSKYHGMLENGRFRQC